MVWDSGIVVVALDGHMPVRSYYSPRRAGLRLTRAGPPSGADGRAAAGGCVAAAAPPA
jgi:hypothetical protein